MMNNVFQPRMEQYFEQIGKIIAAKKISLTVIFMLRDLVELRDNKWVPRREDNYNPKTIDQIHKEAQMEKMQKQRLAAQMPVKDNKQKKGGPGKALVLMICLVFLSGASPKIEHSFCSVSSQKPTVRTAQVLREIFYFKVLTN